MTAALSARANAGPSAPARAALSGTLAIDPKRVHEESA